ncbi:MAG: Tetratricopeptide 2 repeat protein [Myxococcaceae bacterium]|nr:Tetratricopeptide 2 repeat protein [Myxococcaceae bacterium]
MTPTADSQAWWRRVDPSWWVLLAAVAVYANTLGNDFVYDDTTVVVANPVLRAPFSFARAFATDIWGAPREAAWSVHTYRPLLTLSFALDRLVGSARPWSFHLTNLLLHAAASVAFFRGLAARLRDPAAALVAGLAFAVHPLHTDAASCITNRSDLAGALAVLAVYGWHARRGLGASLAGPVALALGMLCKESVVVVFPLLLVRDALGTETSWREKLARYAGYGAAVGAAVALRTAALGSAATLVPDLLSNPLRDASLGVRVWWGVRFVGLVARLLVAPLDLCADYGAAVVRPVVALDGDVLLGAAALVGLVVLAVRARRSDPLVTEACAWVLVTAALYANAAKVLPAAFAERWWYLGAGGAFLLLGRGVAALRERGQGRGVLPAAAVVLALWAAVTVRRNVDWGTSERLFESAVAVQPRSARMRYFVARFRFREERFDESFAHVAVAVRNAPEWAEPYGLYGRLLSMQRRDAEAERAFAHVTAMEGPASREARRYYVDYLTARGRYYDAWAQLAWLRANGLWGDDLGRMEAHLRAEQARPR